MRACSIGSGVLCQIVLQPRPETEQRTASGGRDVQLPRNTLPKFLSSVSGGGYLLCSFTDWLRHKARENEHSTKPEDHNPQQWFGEYMCRMQNYASYFIPALDGAGPHGAISTPLLTRGPIFLFNFILHLIAWGSLLFLVMLVHLPMCYPFSILVDYWVGDFLRTQSYVYLLGPFSMLFFFVGCYLGAKACHALSNDLYDRTKRLASRKQHPYYYMVDKGKDMLQSAIGYVFLFFLFTGGAVLLFFGLSCFVQPDDDWVCTPKLGLRGWLIGWGLITTSFPWFCVIANAEPSSTRELEGRFPSEQFFSSKLTRQDRGSDGQRMAHAYFSTILTNFFFQDLERELNESSFKRLAGKRLGASSKHGLSRDSYIEREVEDVMKENRMELIDEDGPVNAASEEKDQKQGTSKLIAKETRAVCCTRAPWQSVKMLGDVLTFLARTTGLLFVCAVFCEVFYLANAYSKVSEVSPLVANFLIMAIVFGIMSQFGNMLQSVGLIVGASLFTNFMYWRVFKTATFFTPEYTDENWHLFLLICAVLLLVLPLTVHIKRQWVHQYYRYRLQASFFYHKKGRYNLCSHLRYLLWDTSADNIHDLKYNPDPNSSETHYALSTHEIKPEPFGPHSLPIMNVCTTLNGWLQTDTEGRAIYGKSDMSHGDTTDQLVMSSEGILLRFEEGVGAPVEMPSVEGPHDKLRHPCVALSTAMTMAAAAVSYNMGEMDTAAPTKAVRDMIVMLGLNMGKNLDTTNGNSRNTYLRISKHTQLFFSLIMNAITFFWPFLIIYARAPDWIGMFIFVFFVGIPLLNLLLSQIINPQRKVLIVLACLELLPSVLFAVTYSNLERWGSSPGKQLIISDGAFSENMGVLGLAARRVKYIMATYGAGGAGDFPTLIYQLKAKLNIDVEVLRSDRQRRSAFFGDSDMNPYKYISRFEADKYFQKKQWGGKEINDFSLGDFPERVNPVLIDICQFSRDPAHRVMVLRLVYPRMEGDLEKKYRSFCGSKLSENKKGVAAEYSLEEAKNRGSIRNGEEDRVGYLFLLGSIKGDYKDPDGAAALARREGCKGHVRPKHVPNRQVGGCCLACCSGGGLARLCCLQKGEFPTHKTWNQYLSSEHFSAYHLEGIAMAREAYSICLEDDGFKAYGAFLRATDTRNPLRRYVEFSESKSSAKLQEDEFAAEQGTVFTALVYATLPDEKHVTSLQGRLNDIKKLFQKTNGFGWQVPEAKEKQLEETGFTSMEPVSQSALDESKRIADENQAESEKHHGHFLHYWKVATSRHDWTCDGVECPRLNIRRKLIRGEVRYEVHSFGGVPLFKCCSVKHRIAQHEADANQMAREEVAKDLPPSVSDARHRDHALALALHPDGQDPYVCQGCDKQGLGYLYQCDTCNFHLHLECVRPLLTNKEKEELKADGNSEPDDRDIPDEKDAASVKRVLERLPPLYQDNLQDPECDRVLCDVCVQRTCAKYSQAEAVYECLNHPHALAQLPGLPAAQAQSNCPECEQPLPNDQPLLACLACQDFFIHTTCRKEWGSQLKESLEDLRYSFLSPNQSDSLVILPRQPSTAFKTNLAKAKMAGSALQPNTAIKASTDKSTLRLVRITVRTDDSEERDQSQRIDRITFEFSDDSKTQYGGSVTHSGLEETAIELKQDERLVQVGTRSSRNGRICRVGFHIVHGSQEHWRWFGRGGTIADTLTINDNEKDKRSLEELPSIGQLEVELSRDSWIMRILSVSSVEDRLSSAEQFQAHERLLQVSQEDREQMLREKTLELINMGSKCTDYLKKAKLTARLKTTYGGTQRIFHEFLCFKAENAFLQIVFRLSVLAVLMLWAAGILEGFEEVGMLNPSMALKIVLMGTALVVRVTWIMAQSRCQDRKLVQRSQATLMIAFIIFLLVVLVFCYADYNDLFFAHYPNSPLLRWGTVMLAFRVATELISVFGFTLFFYSDQVIPRYFYRQQLKQHHKRKEMDTRQAAESMGASRVERTTEGEGAALLTVASKTSDTDAFPDAEEHEPFPLGEHSGVVAQVVCAVTGVALIGLSATYLGPSFSFLGTDSQEKPPQSVLLWATLLYITFTFAVMFVLFEAAMLSVNDTPAPSHRARNLYYSSFCCFIFFIWVALSCGLGLFMSSLATWILLPLPIVLMCASGCCFVCCACLFGSISG
eukprot:gb/GEZN01000098.1/.p1 GENE.gb/GEZN01000098.1/~~gb/GEZN01000098.1/.p1  ORF type:complete len:2268 (-),score=301.88 gb/GEZN01000098.1/:377-6823(-)